MVSPHPPGRRGPDEARSPGAEGDDTGSTGVDEEVAGSADAKEEDAGSTGVDKEEAGSASAEEEEARSTGVEEEEAGSAAAEEEEAGSTGAEEEEAVSTAAEEEARSTSVEEEEAGSAATEEEDAGSTGVEDEEAGSTATEEKEAGSTNVEDEEAGSAATEEEEAGSSPDPPRWLSSLSILAGSAVVALHPAAHATLSPRCHLAPRAAARRMTPRPEHRHGRGGGASLGTSRGEEEGRWERERGVPRRREMWEREECRGGDGRERVK
ncbi:uncharacterized protein [Miscanthus floridulus]|uniref:uncharacterized protein n=1 Tax=Miscanthus floridulus TaxID=154761 RepID=UPI00345A09B3